MDHDEAARRGKLGGKATVQKYGIEHMRAIGAKGFAAYARKHCGNVRANAVAWLQAEGKVRRAAAATAADLRRLHRALFPEQYGEEEK